MMTTSRRAFFGGILAAFVAARAKAAAWYPDAELRCGTCGDRIEPAERWIATVGGTYEHFSCAAARGVRPPAREPRTAPPIDVSRCITCGGPIVLGDGGEPWVLRYEIPRAADGSVGLLAEHVEHEGCARRRQRSPALVAAIQRVERDAVARNGDNLARAHDAIVEGTVRLEREELRNHVENAEAAARLARMR
jgi:hypothetical protein